MLTTYFTVKTEGSHEIVIQKSRFIGHVKRVETEEEAISFVQKIKKEHKDATHNCSAYMIGEHDLIQKASDDGEPSGTAGVPILEVLKKKGLKDTAVVVTRYFGGIKLGAGGLIRAYSGSASQSIDEIGVVKRQLMQLAEIHIDYTLLGKVENELRQSAYTLRNIDYADRVVLHAAFQSGQEEEFQAYVTDMTNAQAEIIFGGQEYIEEDV
ncbi:YigZ family protein [Terribacillus saccharophilus]|uniref:YigZ family protein n=1 Tax=Terribacillus saccharophilus TaxID=361277 RepID=A0A268AF53_9BACI|nr:YigZ family protein [Terribacillus saccharophilus]PAD22754.1 YigZ family protein [Terribacillus saccharophilus]PAF18049.1 YigZ family protein [Terribacillus saccharophilus]PAF23655.1 YigZ family protein [Terribacillus saccharophilus]PAF37332.1 YigZ family protein [Terribacillus saccharophilus]PAF39829.1 YigZ family protein [Terribacillus saccharophilus]